MRLCSGLIRRAPESSAIFSNGMSRIGYCLQSRQLKCHHSLGSTVKRSFSIAERSGSRRACCPPVPPVRRAARAGRCPRRSSSPTRDGSRRRRGGRNLSPIGDGGPGRELPRPAAGGTRARLPVNWPMNDVVRSRLADVQMDRRVVPHELHQPRFVECSLLEGRPGGGVTEREPCGESEERELLNK